MMYINKQNYRHVLKYKKIQERYDELYNKERRRIDDVRAILEEDFLLSESRLMRIINYRLPPDEQVEEFVKSLKPKAVQMYLEM